MKQGRGQLTKRIKQKSKELLGYVISQDELRLMSYIQYVMVNEQTVKYRVMNCTDIGIYKKWKHNGYITEIENGLGRLTMTKDFWNIVSEIIYLGYVDLK